MKTLLPLILSLALTAPRLFAQTPPPQATAAGYNALVFDDEFTSAATIAPSTSQNTGFKWYPFQKSVAGTYVVSAGGTGTLTINTDTSGYGQDLMTIPESATGTVTQGTFQHGYFEASLQYSSKAVQGGAWPAFWSFSAAAQSEVNGAKYAELDFMEAYPNGALTLLIDTIHNWTGSGDGATGSPSAQNDPDWLTVNPTDGGWHTYGCLWTANKLQFYLDNKLCTFANGSTSVATGPGTSFPALETSRMYLILGTGKNWPMNVDYVHVWQVGTGTITPPPPITQTLTLPTTLAVSQSPYSLPADTSAGLPPTYQVVSGPAQVSGDVLTLAQAGTVVITATQAGNTTYAPLSETGSIVVTQASQSFSKFPETVSLPSTTSAGLATALSVVSGPATASGHTLTITAAGTVIYSETQAGNAPYPPLTVTGTITSQ